MANKNQSQKNSAAEAVQPTAAPAKAGRQSEPFALDRPDETLHLAVDLTKFIKENKLFQNFGGKEYVNVEAWQYAGSRLGLVPVVRDITCTSTDAELRYHAACEIINLNTGQVVGRGFAICSSKEPGKRNYQEFAIASMAQTRSIGKGYRNLLAWIIRAAGYEPTPAEEMDYQGNNTPAPAASTGPAATTPPPAASTSLLDEEEPKIATARQKAEIIKLLNHPVISMDEKNKMLLNINRFDEERAVQAIAKLKKTIEQREAKTGGTADTAGGVTLFTPATDQQLGILKKIAASDAVTDGERADLELELSEGISFERAGQIIKAFQSAPAK